MACARRDSTLAAWYRSLHAPRTGGAYDSHHRTAGIACRTRRRGSSVAPHDACAADGSDASERVLWAAAIGDTPHRAVSVLADEESAVMRYRHADGARPNGGVVHDEAGHEVLVFAGRNAVLQVYADHFVAGPFRAVPRPVLGRERIPTVFRGELVAIVENHSHRGRMRLDQHVGYGDLVL